MSKGIHAQGLPGKSVVGRSSEKVSVALRRVWKGLGGGGQLGTFSEELLQSQTRGSWVQVWDIILRDTMPVRRTDGPVLGAEGLATRTGPLGIAQSPFNCTRSSYGFNCRGSRRSLRKAQFIGLGRTSCIVCRGLGLICSLLRFFFAFWCSVCTLEIGMQRPALSARLGKNAFQSRNQKGCFCFQATKLGLFFVQPRIVF